MRCSSCEVLRINGLICHETDCPDAWRTYRRECKNCGMSFVPQTRREVCCDEICAAEYAGLPCPTEEDNCNGD